MVELRKQVFLSGYELRIAEREFTAFGWAGPGQKSLSVVITLTRADLLELWRLLAEELTQSQEEKELVRI